MRGSNAHVHLFQKSMTQQTNTLLGSSVALVLHVELSVLDQMTIITHRNIHNTYIHIQPCNVWSITSSNYRCNIYFWLWPLFTFNVKVDSKVTTNICLTNSVHKYRKLLCSQVIKSTVYHFASVLSTEIKKLLCKNFP